MSHIGFRVSPLSEPEIESKVEKFRNLVGFRNPTTKIIHIIEHVLPSVLGDAFYWPIVPNGSLGPNLALTTPDKLTIEITEAIYNLAWEGDPLANHILAHELGHLFLHDNVDPFFAFASGKPHYKSIFNSEWQADRFADFLRMPKLDVRATCQSIEEIIHRYNVPEDAAQRRYVELFGPEQLRFDFY